MNEINEELIQQELQKPIGGALLPLEWFLMFSFIEKALEVDGMFASTQDMEAIANTVKRLHNQIFPAPKEYKEQLAEKLAIKPKKIITKPNLVL